MCPMGCLRDIPEYVAVPCMDYNYVRGIYGTAHAFNCNGRVLDGTHAMESCDLLLSSEDDEDNRGDSIWFSV